MIKTGDLPALKQRIRTLLCDELGLARFREDESGDFLFRFERMNLAIVFDDKDPAFLWIAHFSFHWVKGNPAALAEADRCISATNHRVKGAKLARAPDPDKDGDYPVTASVSFLVPDPASVDAPSLERYFSMIKHGCGHFFELLSAADADDEDEASQEAGPAAVRH